MTNGNELQKKSLELFLYFEKVCKEHHLLYYLCGGCCIGTIRHQGFIPWDDDIDIFMPRDDYEKLKIIWSKFSDIQRYSIMYPREDFINHNLFITIADEKTTYIRDYQKNLDISHGVVLDVLPLDGHPNSEWKRYMQIVWAYIYSLYCAQIVPVKHGGVIKFISEIMLHIIPSKKLRYKIWHYAEKQMIKYKIEDCDSITELCSGPMYMKKKYPKDAFKKAIYKNFEGHQVPIPIGYHEYLSIAFGDYMKLPPVEKQRPHHEAAFCDLKNSYKIYKGTYYCREE